MINIFGYGSLINPNSVSDTLGRSVKVSPAIIHNYYRTWTASTTVLLNDEIAEINFLDLTFKDGSFCNGITFQVDENELHRLDCRECGYSKEHVDIFILENKKISGVEGLVYTVSNDNKSRTGCVATKYKSLVEEGLSHYNRSFKQTFLATTEVYDGCYVKGSYRFNNK